MAAKRNEDANVLGTDARVEATAEEAREAVIAARPNDAEDPSVANMSDNVALEHTAGDRTTRDDPLDLGVPMLPGSPYEPQGPEDALGRGAKRGDYTARIGGNEYHPHTAVPILDAKPGEPRVMLVAQRPNAADIGDDEGVKGGVGNDPFNELATGNRAGGQVRE